jgi:hypothetical protein
MAMPRAMLSRSYGETICQRLAPHLHVLASLLPVDFASAHSMQLIPLGIAVMKNKNLAVVRLVMLIGQNITFLAVPIISVG